MLFFILLSQPSGILNCYCLLCESLTSLSFFGGVSGNNDAGKKKILLLKGKEREIITVSF